VNSNDGTNWTECKTVNVPNPNSNSITYVCSANDSSTKTVATTPAHAKPTKPTKPTKPASKLSFSVSNSAGNQPIQLPTYGGGGGSSIGATSIRKYSYGIGDGDNSGINQVNTDTRIIPYDRSIK
jgi:hypothetical protein